MRRTLFVLLVAGIVVGGPAAYAHHSFAADYWEDRSTSIDGDVKEFLYRNPHAMVLVNALDEQGKMVTFGAEWFGAGRLKQQGISADVLKPGDHVMISGAPGRNPADHRIHLRRIERPADGWTWSGGRGRR